LGLAIVYGIVTQAGGSVVISSQPAHGTNVEVILPSTRDFPLARKDAPLGRALASRGQMILLVENEAMVREPTRRILIGSGYAVLAASTAEEALRIAAEHVGRIELLLTDVVMPGGSGKDLAADLSRMSPRTKVLYMSGYASQAIRLRAVSVPGLNRIEKPFASDDLLQRVHAVLNNR
jgi:two-component system, cell cycle sensor histidine kinase and response regulator CckA